MLKEQILKLRSEGKTYNQISAILGCSKSTVSYYCGEGQQEKVRIRNINYKKTFKASLTKKIARVFKRKVHDNLKYKTYISSGEYSYGKEGQEDFINKCMSNPFCYLTGVLIDLGDSKSYEIDHVIPLGRGGTNSFDNLAICTRNANRVKADLLLEELYVICNSILSNRS